jgi:hypothetical protein
MVISETLLVDVEPTRKQLTMPAYAVSALQSGKIKKMSKGLIAYECLMLANEKYEDSLQQIRAHVESKLEDALFGFSWSETAKKIILSREGQARLELFESCSFDDPERDISHVEVWLPNSIEGEIPRQRYVGQLVTEAIVHTVASPWESRTELIRDVLDLTALARGDAVEEDEVSEFVLDVMTGRSTTYSQELLEPLHDAVMRDSPQRVDDTDVERDLMRSASAEELDEALFDDADGVPAWASEYDWDSAGVSPESELGSKEALEDAASVANTRRQRVPVLFARMNQYGREAGEHEVDPEHDGDTPWWITEENVTKFANMLYGSNMNIEEGATQPTLTRYVEETVALMRESPLWRESVIHQMFNEGCDLPREFLVTKKDNDGNVVRDENGVVFESVDSTYFANQFEYVPTADSESLWAKERRAVEAIREKFAEDAHRLMNPTFEGKPAAPQGHNTSKAKALEESVEHCDVVLERFNELGV